MRSMTKRISQQYDFKGLADWVPIFRAGKQVDSKGRDREWTHADLDQVVANHDPAHPAPHVITHKELYSPFAYARTSELKREGDLLLAKSKDIEPQFETLLKDGRLYERSVRLVPTDKGWKLGHIAWLGAEPPAVAGLAPVQFEASGEACDYSMDWRATNTLSRLMRGMRDFFIEQFGLEKADRALPEWDVSALADIAKDAEPKPESITSFSSSFPLAGEKNKQGDQPMPEFSQADIDRAVTAERDRLKAEYAASQKTLQDQLAAERRAHRSAAFQAFRDEMVDAGHAPAALTGVVEFLHAIDAVQDATFEFAADGGGQKSIGLVEWFQDFAKGRKPDVKMGRSDAGAAGVDVTNPEAIAAAARKYQADHEAKTGQSIHFAEAVYRVSSGQQS